MKKEWWKESVVYQIYPRSFMDSNGDGIGDLQGIIMKLDYLKELGIDTIWLSPVYQSPNDDNGYDISDYYTIMEELGTMEDWEELLDQIHMREMRLIMDLVVNHTSDEHEWFVQSKSSKENEYRDYYIWREGKAEGVEPNNWASNFGGSAWEYNNQTGDYYLHLFSKKQPDLNWDNENVRQDIYKMMRWWLDKGIDGFRMDVINFISKEQGLPDGEPKLGKSYVSGSKYYRNGPKIHMYLQEMNKEVLSHYDAMTVGEMPGVSPEEAKDYTSQDRNELNMVFQFEHVGLDNGPNGKWDLKKVNLLDLKQSLSRWQNALSNDGWNSLYFNNHDQPRSVSRFGNDKKYRVESAKMLATLLHMMKGTPYVYQGEELGMTNIEFESIEGYRDIETIQAYKDLKEQGLTEDQVLKSLYAKSRDNARTPMQWDSSENGGFTSGTPWIQVNPNYSVINAEAEMANEHSIFSYYSQLIMLRKQQDLIKFGDYQLVLENDPDIFAYLRTYEDKKLLVICNFYEKEPVFKIPNEINFMTKQLLISNYVVNAQSSITEINLQPYETRVYLLN
ncbi:glycoside hydrolase family 13 protein [Sutcliffiella rhizosphaerae]|uniref:oligo-1,6-glucosidase n=1 Tax=Sutcliffiella rhizosphaerae TaxID=2880967 RepID=A0ABM8YJ18_9BACI|nr:alpha-glucosidase [Sutcliffiella rhizosphaerae]CAG9619924.1 Oligo-1,6-glucosidase [Sutcliffiella rhizosphaerae]